MRGTYDQVFHVTREYSFHFNNEYFLFGSVKANGLTRS